MLNSSVLDRTVSEPGSYAISDAVVKLKSFEFSFRREPADFVPEPDFVPFLWEKKNDGNDEGGAAGPDDDPENDDVAMDEDEGLPWPDPERIRTWWSGNAQDFSPGTRFFMGAPPSWSHCMQVLRSGFQRQRLAAAEHLCLLVPGTLLFPTNAPAWRQSQWLAQMADA
jgi:hypothetical protein